MLRPIQTKKIVKSENTHNNFFPKNRIVKEGGAHNNFFPKNRNGVSSVIGYILLIGITMAISVFVYMWIKTYIPRDIQNCPDGTSIFIKEASCQIKSDTEYVLNLTLKNNGRFNVAGYFILATDGSDQELATVDLSSKLELGGDIADNAILFSEGDNAIAPNQEKKSIFNLAEQIYSLEITPIRFQTEENRQRLVSCGDAKVKEIVSCTDTGVPLQCIPDCGTNECGYDPVCGTLECGNNNCIGDYGVGWVCNSGSCVDQSSCSSYTCSSLGYECDLQTICGEEKICGLCLVVGEVCSLGQCVSACGNGVVNSGEECDDGGVTDGDGCSSTCTIDIGWSCTGTPSDCEENIGGYGCEDYCQDLQIGYTGGICTGNTGQCTSIPGDVMGQGQAFFCDIATYYCCCYPPQ